MKTDVGLRRRDAPNDDVDEGSRISTMEINEQPNHRTRPTSWQQETNINNQKKNSVKLGKNPSAVRGGPPPTPYVADVDVDCVFAGGVIDARFD